MSGLPEKMPLGHDLDGFVAERVMGYQWRRAPLRDNALKGLISSDPEEFGSWKPLQGDEKVASDWWWFLPKFSADMDAALDVVEVLQARGWDAHLYRCSDGYVAKLQSAALYSVTATVDPRDCKGRGFAMALCVAVWMLDQKGWLA